MELGRVGWEMQGKDRLARGVEMVGVGAGRLEGGISWESTVCVGFEGREMVDALRGVGG